jgi:CO/xanthine dehydrogenase Mo-binding subunit
MTAPFQAGAGHSRRRFLAGSGALIVSFGACGWREALAGQGTGGSAAPPAGIDPGRLDSWIAITAAGDVEACTGKCELGQGILTAQIQLIAEELGVAVERVRLAQSDTARTPDQGTTSGSNSHPANFNQRNLARAAATAREALLGLAAERLGVPAERLTVREGVVAVSGDPSRRVSYAELVEGRSLDIPLNETAPRRAPAEWTVLGTPVPRVDVPALVTGSFEFVHDVRVPGMLHGAVVRPPAPGARLESVDERSVLARPGVVRVVVKRDFVGVVAETRWQALEAAGRLPVKWSPGVPLPPREGFYDGLRKQKPVRDTLVVDSGDTPARLAGAALVVEATYRHPYQMHGSLGTSCAVADVGTGGATLWSPTQAVYPLRRTLSMLLGLPEESVHVVYRLGSGCYGLNGADTVSYDAALLSQAVGRPVRVQLSRRDEMAWENFGNAFVVDQRVGVDAEGRIVAWEYEAWSPRLGSRPGGAHPGNVVTGSLVGFPPETFEPRSPAPAPRGGFRNGSNAAPSYVTGCVEGRCGGTGTVRGERVLSHSVESAFFTGPLRAPGRLQNTFAHEGLMDEVAARVGADPVAYRLRHLADPRLAECVKRAAEAAGWDARPSPRPDRPAAGVAPGRGIACVLYKGNNGYAAMVAEVDVDQGSGAVRARRVVVAHDCGPVSNPDGVVNQIEGGALQGLSRALGEEVTWDDAGVTSVDWSGYPSLSLGFEMPVVESVLIDRPEGEALGAGETSITLVAAALGNAIFDATGARIREVPFTRERVRAALAARPR